MKNLGQYIMKVFQCTSNIQSNFRSIPNPQISKSLDLSMKLLNTLQPSYRESLIATRTLVISAALAAKSPLHGGCCIESPVQTTLSTNLAIFKRIGCNVESQSQIPVKLFPPKL
ncbi:hypothetical protein HPP92_023327 [Vanilla planifolia]|uniref:Uncharacterized protein n=1 Tax=Vanilla planifolia TaxID=51239 RepID=A0A835PZ75_VANPL|nr:hypothetical protein HPP92_023327 [Vanilla planifolia]